MKRCWQNFWLTKNVFKVFNTIQLIFEKKEKNQQKKRKEWIKNVFKIKSSKKTLKKAINLNIQKNLKEETEEY